MDATPSAQSALPAPLVASNVSVRRQGRDVVQAVSLTLHAGQWLAIVGPNGAGKSSLLGALAGLRAATAGQVQLMGRDIAQWPPRDRAQHLAWLAQQGQAEGDMAAIDVVRLGRLARHGLLGAPDAADEAAVHAAMLETECSAFAQRRLSQLSGGERQRVLLARVLASDAQVMLLDEPGTHLDAPHQRALLRSVRRRARGGAAVATVLHDIGLALLADRVLVMARGRVVADGAPQDANLRAALVQVFDDAFSIEPLLLHDEKRWAVLPRSA